MLNKKEHILALKISSLLLIVAFFIGIFLQYINHNFLFFHGLYRGYFKYILIIILSIFIYFISYYFAKKTFEPIKQANKKLEEYNYNLAHELKTPLAVIKSDLELLELGEKIDYNIIKSSKDEIVSMQEIIDSLLFLTQKENNLKKQKISLDTLIKEIIKGKFDENMFNLNLQKNIQIKASKNLIEILIKNLIENALKHGDTRKKINIELTKTFLKIENHLNKNNNKIDKNKLFDSFYQADNSRNTKGFGLGLNIVKKIIDLHNFKINIDIKNDLFIVIVSF